MPKDDALAFFKYLNQACFSRFDPEASLLELKEIQGPQALDGQAYYISVSSKEMRFQLLLPKELLGRLGNALHGFPAQGNIDKVPDFTLAFCAKQLEHAITHFFYGKSTPVNTVLDKSYNRFWGPAKAHVQAQFSLFGVLFFVSMETYDA